MVIFLIINKLIHLHLVMHMADFLVKEGEYRLPHSRIRVHQLLVVRQPMQHRNQSKAKRLLFCGRTESRESENRTQRRGRSPQGLFMATTSINPGSSRLGAGGKLAVASVQGVSAVRFSAASVQA